MASIELLRRFENYLIRGKYRPGDRIPGEQELAAHFGVSRGTMREAIACCVSRGLLERRTSRGTVLRLPTPEEIAPGFLVSAAAAELRSDGGQLLPENARIGDRPGGGAVRDAAANR